MSADGTPEVFEEILAAIERGEDLGALRRRHSGSSDTIERLIAAAQQYVRSVRLLSGRRPAPDDLLSSGDRLGDFEAESLLARGGEGEVYRARQHSLGDRLVALKVVPAESRTSSARKRFEREALLLAELHHPYLAEVFGFGEERGLLFLAMRLVEGESLESLARAFDEQVPAEARPRRLVRWAAQVAEALSEVHGRGLVHRDVKPSNIVIQRRPGDESGRATGDAVLVDFGLARPVDSSTITRTGWAVATPQFASPEQLLGMEVDARGDVFSLGATLHDLLTGRGPQDRPQASAGLEPIRSVLPTLSADLAAIVDRACEAEPRWRYPEAGALAEDLRRWLRGEPVSARRPSVARRAEHWLHEHPRLLYRSVLVAVLASVAVTFLTGLGRWLGAAEEARTAWRSGDLAALQVAAPRIPSAVLPAVLAEAGVRDAVRRLAAARPGDPLVSAAAALRADDIDSALRIALTSLQRGGLGSEPALARLVLGILQDDDDPERRLVALRYTARLMYETPVWTPEQRQAARPWREAIAAILGSSTGEERLFAVSSLAGCGDPADVLMLLELAAETESQELRRLSESTCVRLVRRGLNAGGLEELDLPGVLARTGLELPSILETVAATGRSRQMYDLFSALIIASHARGREVDLRPYLPATAIAALETRSRIGSRLATLLSIARDPVMEAWIGCGEYRSTHSASPRHMGILCQNIGDQWLISRVREDILREEGDEGLREFDKARADAMQILSGHLAKEILDPQTYLTHEAGAGRPESLTTDVGLPAEEVLAVWDFSGASASRAGGATSACGVHAEVGRDRAGSYLLLYRFGESEVRLCYEIPEGSGIPWGELRLDHLDARRTYYPHGGWVELDITWDGQVITKSRRIDGFETFGRSLWEVPERFLSPGRHEIVLRLSPRTNTTYRLVRAELAPSHGLPPRLASPDGRK